MLAPLVADPSVHAGKKRVKKSLEISAGDEEELKPVKVCFYIVFVWLYEKLTSRKYIHFLTHKISQTSPRCFYFCCYALCKCSTICLPFVAYLLCNCI